MEWPKIEYSYWILQTLAMMITVFLIPRLTVRGPIPAFLTVLSLAFINAHLWNAALFFSIPDSFTVKALLLLVINGLIFWVVVKVLPGIEIKGLLPALAAPLVFTICSLVLSEVNSRMDWSKIGKTTLQMIQETKEYLEHNTGTGDGPEGVTPAAGR